MKRALLGILFLLFCAKTASGQPSLANRVELEAYFDGMINTYLQQNHIAGATLGIIKDGQPLLVKGYGFSDVQTREPVAPDSTLFRIASISKTFVWTAVMQLVEEGKLDLNTDVNAYLQGVRIAEAYGQPVTLKNLMTHTAGFEEYFIGFLSLDSSKMKPLKQVVADKMPARVFPPGKFATYSNRGTGIAALVVEQVSGVPFEDYVKQNILQPLGMTSTTFRQPLPDTLESRLSGAYEFGGGEFVEKPFEFVPLGPVGGASSTATDIMRYMQAHLNLGQYNGNAILDSTTAKRMQSPAFRQDPALNAMRLGFYDLSQNGVTIFGHDGDTYWFHSLMALFPEKDMGIFLSLNSQQGSAIKREILKDFVDHYFPDDGPFKPARSFGREYLQQFAGDYRSMRYARERFTKVLTLSDKLPVRVSENGRLKIIMGGKASYWLPVDSLTFRKAGGSENLVFKKDDEGNINYFFSDRFPFDTFEKIPPLESRGLHIPLFIIAIIVMGIFWVYWPLANLVRLQYRPTTRANAPLPAKMNLAAWVTITLLGAFYLGIAVWLIGPEAIIYGLPSWVKGWFVLPVLCLFSVLLMILYTWRMWQKSLSGMPSRICYTLLTVVMVIHLWQLYYWNILGFQY